MTNTSRNHQVPVEIFSYSWGWAHCKPLKHPEDRQLVQVHEALVVLKQKMCMPAWMWSACVERDQTDISKSLCHRLSGTLGRQCILCVELYNLDTELYVSSTKKSHNQSAFLKIKVDN